MNYLVGDVQGCAGALERLLAAIAFSPSRDRLYVLGDLVNRGPDSLGTLRRLRDLGGAATCVLGNHDWHLLAVAAGVRPRHRSDTLDDILDAPDREAWLDWVRQRRMAVHEHGWLMLHAGVVPQWDLALTLDLAGRAREATAAAPARASSWHRCSATSRLRWSDSLRGDDRLRFTLNTLTRTRFVAADGTLEFRTKDGADAAPAGFFAVVRRAGPEDGRHADRVRPLVGARPGRAQRPARPRHRLRLGRQAQRCAHRRRAARAGPGRLRSRPASPLSRIHAAPWRVDDASG